MLLILLTSFFISSKFSPSADLLFNGTIVFYPQHQDDETLWSGPAILKALEQCGPENVYIVLVSDGSGIKILNTGEYSNLNRYQKFQIRNTEFKGALNALGVNKENIIFLNELDSNDDLDFDNMKKIALSFEENFLNVTHIAHSYELDWHEQHLSNGNIIKQLYDNNQINNALFFTRPKYEKYIPNQEKIIITTENNSYKKLKNACYYYKKIDILKGLHGIGYQSDHKSFDKLLSINKSILHTPNVSTTIIDK